MLYYDHIRLKLRSYCKKICYTTSMIIYTNDGHFCRFCRFQIGATDDACECLEAILKRLHFEKLACDPGRSNGGEGGNGGGNGRGLQEHMHPMDRTCQPQCIAHKAFGYDCFDQVKWFTQVYNIYTCYNGFILYGFNIFLSGTTY